MRIKYIIRILVSISLLFFVYYNIDKIESVSSIQNISVTYTLYSILIFILLFLLNALRLNVIVSIFKNSTYYKSLDITIISNALSLFVLPGITSEISRYFLINRYIGPTKSQTIITLLYDRTCGMLATLITTFSGALFLYASVFNVSKLQIVLILFFGILFFLMTVFQTLKIAKLFNLFNFYYLKKFSNLFIPLLLEVEKRKFVFLYSVFLSVLLQFCTILIVYFIFLDLEKTIKFELLILIMPLMTIITSAPISFGGIGVRELVFAAGFSLAAISESVSYVISLNFTILLFFTISMLYLINISYKFLFKINE